jgi:hypothetical protein
MLRSLTFKFGVKPKTRNLKPFKKKWRKIKSVKKVAFLNLNTKNKVKKKEEKFFIKKLKSEGPKPKVRFVTNTVNI